ncbi:MAG TPA: antioxidant AhpC [Opitutae bacterium]|nr:antioxidant AhpC [Opitutae bacterium]
MKSFLVKPAIIIASCFLAFGANSTLGKSADEATPLLIGASVPEAKLAGQEGNDVQLTEILGGRSSVVILYRGSWCPYLNTQLKKLASIEDDLKKLGYQIVAISPDKPESLNVTDAKHDLGYQLYSDSRYQAMEAFGIDFDSRRGKLPVPSVFLVTPDLEISF